MSERLHQVGGRTGRTGTPSPHAFLHRLCLRRLFGHSGACSGCSQPIPASEMVMRAQGNVYHLKVTGRGVLLDPEDGDSRGRDRSSAPLSVSAVPPVGPVWSPEIASTTSTVPSSVSRTGPAPSWSAPTCPRCRAAP